MIFLLEWISIVFVLEMLNLKTFLQSHGFARLRQVWSDGLKIANVVADYKNGRIISKVNS